MKKYRIAAIGFAHVHMLGNIKRFADLGERVELVAAADIAPHVKTQSRDKGTRLQQLEYAVEVFGFKKYEDYERLLEENSIDIAVVCAENAFHPKVLETILRKGIHAVVEKPLAMTMEGALRISRAAEEGGAKVITNWPVAWLPEIRAAKKVVESGAIGKPFKFSYRNADSLGPFSYGQNLSAAEKGREWWYRDDMGGGAMMDYCSYGACMSSWFLGKPLAASGLKANFFSLFGSADDYASITVRFNGAAAQLEGSWTTVNSGVPNGPLIYGDKGTLVTRQNGTVELYKTRHSEEPDEAIKAEPLPLGRETLAKEVLYHLDTGEPLFPLLDLPLNLAAVSILDAGRRSARSGKTELVNDKIWCTGDDFY